MSNNRGYMRGHVDRDITDDGLLWFTAATEGVKGDGIDLRMDGAQLTRFRSNPVILFGHNAYGRANLPIGRAPEVKVEGNRLRMGVTFDQDDDFARTVERKIRNGFLNAVSIGFDVLSWENPSQNYWKGGVATKWELFETSVVPIPMDDKAVVEAGRSDENLREQILSWINAHMDERLEEWQRHYLNEEMPAVPVIGEADASRVMASITFGDNA